MWCTYLARSSHSDSIIFVSTSYGILHLIFNPKFFLDIFRMENNHPQLNFWWFRSILLSSSSSYPHSNPRKVDTKLHHLKIQAIVKFWSSLDFLLRFLENMEQNKIYFWAVVKQRCNLVANTRFMRCSSKTTTTLHGMFEKNNASLQSIITFLFRHFSHKEEFKNLLNLLNFFAIFCT